MPQVYSQLFCHCLLPWVSVATRSSFWSVYKDIARRHRRAGAQPAGDHTVEQLRDLVHHAYTSVTFYRSRMDALGLKPDALQSLDDFRQLPPITKGDIEANFPDGLLSSQRAHGPWRYVATSGTVDRVTIVQDFRKRDFGRAAQLLSLNTATGYLPGMKYMEIPPDVCANVCGVAGTQEPRLLAFVAKAVSDGTIFQAETASTLRGLVERQIVYRRLDLPSFGPGGLQQSEEALDQYLKQIDEYRPHVLKALPAYLYLLAVRIQNGGKRPRVEGGIMPMGSSMTPHMKRVVESTFQSPVHEDYGCAEVGTMAAECGRQNGLHPFGDLFYIEVVRNGRAVRDGEVGKILITDLRNYAMPLIRYEIGDVGTILRQPCACGLAGDRLDVQGRLHDCLVADDGSIVPSDTVFDTMLAQPGVLAFQIDERPDGEFQVRVVPCRDSQLHLDDVADCLARLVGRSRRIVARLAGTILPERGGKYRFVRNLTDAPALALQ